MSEETEARNVFISFRYSDGIDYKNKLVELFDKKDDTVDFSEDKDRRDMTEETIKKYIYAKLRRSSVTIILLTPQAISYKRNIFGEIDDWLYDEVRYSLEDREGNRTNGLIAVYTKEAEPLLIYKSSHKCPLCNGYNTTTVLDQQNLFRKNMMNVKDEFKTNKCKGIYDSDYDSFCSLVPFDTFYANPSRYIKIAYNKHLDIEKYEIKKRI